MKDFKEIGHNPYIDWILIISLSCIVTIVLALSGIYLYNAVTKGDIQRSSLASPNVKKDFDTKVLSSIIKALSQKEDIIKKTKIGYTGSVDPSL